MTPVFAPRNYVDWNRERAGRLLRRAKFNSYANDRPFNTFSNSICVHAPRVVVHGKPWKSQYRSLCVFHSILWLEIRKKGEEEEEETSDRDGNYLLRVSVLYLEEVLGILFFFLFNF